MLPVPADSAKAAAAIAGISYDKYAEENVAADEKLYTAKKGVQSSLFGKWRQRRKERKEEKERELERAMQMPWDTIAFDGGSTEEWGNPEFSSIAIVFIIILGMLISYIVVRQKGLAGQLMDLLIMFPFVIPGAVLGISLIVAFNKQPVILTGTAMIMIIAFIVRKLPYTVRSGSAFLQQMDVSVEEASISLGVSPMKTFVNVTARLMAPGVLSGAILSCGCFHSRQL